MKKYSNKEHTINEEDNEDLKSSSKCWDCDNVYIDNDVKGSLRAHCHITGKYRGSASRDCNINVKLNPKIPVVFHYLKYYDSHFIMQELGKYHLKTNVISSGFEKGSQ